VSYSIVVCAGLVPDPLQSLEPIQTPQGPALKNEMMLPAVLDNWAFCALVEAGRLAKSAPGSKVYLVSVAPKAKLQQVMMTVAQKVPFELVSLDGPASGFADARPPWPKPSRPSPTWRATGSCSSGAGNRPHAAPA